MPFSIELLSLRAGTRDMRQVMMQHMTYSEAACMNNCAMKNLGCWSMNQQYPEDMYQVPPGEDREMAMSFLRESAMPPALTPYAG